MSNKVFVGSSVVETEESKPLLPYSKVVIILGNDDEGNQLTYEAGNDSGRTLEIDNPWGTQAMANNILAQIRGYTYLPFESHDAYVPDDAELGDGITISGLYSVLAEQKITWDQLMVSDVSAPGADETSNEFGLYVNRAERAAERRLNGITTKFTVELGLVESDIQEELFGPGGDYDHPGANSVVGKLQSNITQTANSIMSTVSATYLSQQDASTTYATKTQVTQTANSITSTVASAQSKYVLPVGVNITHFGYGAPPDNASFTGYYLDQASGYYYYRLSTSSAWGNPVNQGNPLPLITTEVSSQIEQTADSIISTVASAQHTYTIPAGVTISYYGYGSPDIPTTGNNGKYYLDQSAGRYYKCVGSTWQIQGNDRLPYTESSSIEQFADSITLSVSSTNGYSYFTISGDGITGASETVQLTVDSFNISGTIYADAVNAGASIASPSITGGSITGGTIYGGTFASDDGSYYLVMGDGYHSNQLTLNHHYGNWTDEVFSIWDDQFGSVSFEAYNNTFLLVYNGSDVIAYGNWDFSNANVTGI